jgi:hypothetical protein
MNWAQVGLSSAGILVTMLGVYIVYANSPINFTVIDGGHPGDDWAGIERAAARRNILIRIGVYVVLLGSFLQLVSNFAPMFYGAAA